MIRNVEIRGEHRAKRFSTWAPKAIAGIGDLIDTLEDRSIILTMQRKAPGQTVERLRRRDNADFVRVRSQALRWASDNQKALEDADDHTEVPDMSNDRAADNWRPLLGIADLAGGEWPTKAREAALAISGEQSPDTDGIRLLADIREVFGTDDYMYTKIIIERLTADPEKPWADYKNGKPIGPKHIGSDPSIRQSDCATGTSSIFSKRPKDEQDGSKKSSKSQCRKDSDGWTDKTGRSGRSNISD